MANSLKLYSDAGLSAEVTSIPAIQADDGSVPAVVRHLYLGSALSGKTFQAVSNPGVDPIAVSIADSNGATGATPAKVKLALTEAGLTSATPGAALNVGVTLLSGSANAVSVWVEINGTGLATGTYNDLSLTTTNTVET